MQRELDVKGGGLYECSWEQGPSVCGQKCLEGSHRRYTDDLNRKSIAKRNRTNAEPVGHVWTISVIDSTIPVAFKV